jgi:transcriptional regulator with XRE-family HTH domain
MDVFMQSAEQKVRRRMRHPLNSFTVNPDRPREQEEYRYRLIVARLRNGMTQVEAAKRLGYQTSAQLNKIESGAVVPPRDLDFLLKVSHAYSVSVDFLLGLSPNEEYDSRVQQQHAILRGTEDVMAACASQIASAMVMFTNQTQPVPRDYRRVVDAVERVTCALQKLRERGEFDDLLGSNPVLKAVELLDTAAEPLREKLKEWHGIDEYFRELRDGKMPPIPHLTDRFSQRELDLD